MSASYLWLLLVLPLADVTATPLLTTALAAVAVQLLIGAQMYEQKKATYPEINESLALWKLRHVQFMTAKDDKLEPASYWVRRYVWGRRATGCDLRSGQPEWNGQCTRATALQHERLAQPSHQMLSTVPPHPPHGCVRMSNEGPRPPAPPLFALPTTVLESTLSCRHLCFAVRKVMVAGKRRNSFSHP